MAVCFSSCSWASLPGQRNSLKILKCHRPLNLLHFISYKLSPKEILQCLPALTMPCWYPRTDTDEHVRTGFLQVSQAWCLDRFHQSDLGAWIKCSFINSTWDLMNQKLVAGGADKGWKCLFSRSILGGLENPTSISAWALDSAGPEWASLCYIGQIQSALEDLLSSFEKWG